MDQVSENAGVATEFVIDAAGFEVTESAEKAGDGELKNGGTLTFEMGPKPSQWGTDPRIPE